MPYAQYLGGVFISTKLKVSGTKKPDAKPAVNCRVSKVGKFGDSGVRMEISPKAEAAMNRTRLGPNAIPIQTAAGATSIWAADCTVVIQAPSSNPAWTAPRISASPKVESRPFSVEMNVPMSTANKPSQGIWVGAGGKPGGPGGGLPSSGFWTCSLTGARGP